MKKRLATILLSMSLFFFSASTHAAETYTLDAAHTAVTWTINHMGFSNPWGKFSMIDGSLTLDEQSPAKSQVNATISMDTLLTGVAKLDEHLKSKDFFDVATYPNASFTSTSVTTTSAKTATVLGNLTMRGITKPVTLYVTLNKLAPNMQGKKTAGFSATATIKRSDFGMSAYLPMLGDEVKLYIESEANISG